MGDRRFMNKRYLGIGFGAVTAGASMFVLINVFKSTIQSLADKEHRSGLPVSPTLFMIIIVAGAFFVLGATVLYRPFEKYMCEKLNSPEEPLKGLIAARKIDIILFFSVSIIFAIFYY